VDDSVVGVIIFVLGGLAGAVFYLPVAKVTEKKWWAWESSWLVYALAGLVVVPWALALSTSPNLLPVLAASPPKEIGYCVLCGAMWGVGGLTWGLMIRYLGVGLGLAIGCGLCSTAGTLIPPILAGNLAALYGTPAANVSLAGVAVSVLGIVLVGMAGMSKENELPEEVKKKTVAEYDFKKGILVAVFSGLMSSGLSFGLQGGPTLELKALHGSQTQVAKGEPGKAPAELAAVKGLVYEKDAKAWIVPSKPEGEATTTPTWRGMPVLVAALAGGFLVNFLWCLYLNGKNRTFGDYFNAKTALGASFLLSALAGALWCSQFICFKTGEPRMGERAYIGWAVLMASMILFSTILGILRREWSGTSGRTRGLLVLGLLLLLASSGLAAYSGYKAKEVTGEKPTAACASATPVRG
jgi:L-rhamnose-H+ transport protein